jgi:hypothetical protein
VVYTDHRTLENFDKQKHLSQWQARWMEFLSQYEFKIVYIPGENNSCADALSRTNFPHVTNPPIAPVLSISADEDILEKGPICDSNEPCFRDRGDIADGVFRVMDETCDYNKILYYRSNAQNYNIMGSTH